MIEPSRMAEELNNAGEISDDECGEWWILMAAMWPRVLDGASKEFQDAYIKELGEEYAHFKRDFVISTRQVTRTVTVREIEYDPA